MLTNMPNGVEKPVVYGKLVTPLSTRARARARAMGYGHVLGAAPPDPPYTPLLYGVDA